jgi:hypothetical protein
LAFEVLVRFDDDDKEAKLRLQEIAPIKCFFGKRPHDWNTVCETLFSELAGHAHGEWIWPMSDDMEIQGLFWDKQLSEFPVYSWSQPEGHWLGTSKYSHDAHGPVPIIRRSFWESNRFPRFPLVDYKIWEACESQGLELKWLKGITVWHKRDDDETLARHRLK